MEHTEEKVEAATPEPEVTPSEPEIADILTDGLKGIQTTPEAGTEPAETKPEEQPKPEGEVTPEAEAPFAELLLEDEKKLAFKTEEDFQKFLDANQVLKDGFLRQSDYTQKTQAVSEEKKVFEEQQKKADEAWGKVKPDDTSMNGLKSIWNAFSTSTPETQDKIQAFVQDALLLSNGQTPIGPLRTVAESQSGEVSPEVVELKRELLGLKQEMTGFKTQAQEKEQSFQEREKTVAQEKAGKTVEDWISGKEKSGVKLTQEILDTMSHFTEMVDPSTKAAYSLDEAFRMARFKLGLSEVDATKKVFADAKDKSKKSASPPTSKASSDQRPEPKDVGEILRQEAEEMAAR